MTLVEPGTGPPTNGSGPDVAAEATNKLTAKQATSNGSDPTPALPALDDIGEAARAA